MTPSRSSYRWWRRAPPWWPLGEPWPPRDRRTYRYARRARFVRRSGWLSFLPAWGLFWILALGFRAVQGVGGASLGAVQLLLVCAAAAGVIALVVRRLAAPVADIVSAADRIAHRDYRVRVQVPESGPAWIGDTVRAFNAMANELEAQDAARRQLMADIAHELRTPLAVVQGTLEGLIDGVYPRDDERLQGVLEDTRVLGRLIDDLRTLATAEGGALALAKEPVDVVALCHDVVASFDARAHDAGVALGVESALADAIEPVTIDPVRIREVLTNLVANALRHTPRGGRVTIALGDAAASIEVRVADTGVGVAPADLPHIFDRFYKGAGSSGSGLGLTIARRLVEAHGGTMRVERIEGLGTTMVFTLPR